MSLQTRLAAFITAVGADIKALQQGAAATRARVRLSAGSHTSSGNMQKVPFDTVVSDPDLLFDATNKRFVCNKAGPYVLGAQVSMAPHANGSDRVAVMAVNGAQVGSGKAPPHASAWARISLPAVTVYLNVGDYFEVYAYQDSGGTLAYLYEYDHGFGGGAGPLTWMNMVRVVGAKGDVGPAGSVNAMTEAGAVRWSRASDGALIAEQIVATTEGTNKLATLTERASAAGTGKAELVLEAKNGTPVARIRVKNDPSLATNKRKVSLEVTDESGSVTQIKDLLRSDGTSDIPFDAVRDTDWVACSFANGCSNYGNNWVPLRYRYIGAHAIQLMGMVNIASGLSTGSLVAGNLPSTVYNQMCPSWANGISGAGVTRFDVNRLSGGLYLAQSSYGVNWHWFNSVLAID